MIAFSSTPLVAVIIASLCLCAAGQTERSLASEDEPRLSRRFGFDDDLESDPQSLTTESRSSNSQEPMCPVSLSQSFELIRALNNFRMSHGLSVINISRSLMSTGCAHMRDLTANKDTINGQCGIHSWSSCCYPTDHSNPNCMHRKALQVTTTLKWNLYNVASYELAYEWGGGSFSPVRAIDMFVSNPSHRQFILQEDLWSAFEWRAIGAAVGVNSALIWFGTLKDPNGDFDQFEVEPHVMELPGCVCNASPVTWTPPSPEDLQSASNATAAAGPIYSVSTSEIEELELELMRSAQVTNSTNSHNTTESPIPGAAQNTTNNNTTESSIPGAAQNTTNMSKADSSTSINPTTVATNPTSLSLDQFLKSLTMGDSPTAN